MAGRVALLDKGLLALTRTVTPYPTVIFQFLSEFLFQKQLLSSFFFRTANDSPVSRGAVPPATVFPWIMTPTLIDSYEETGNSCHILPREGWRCAAEYEHTRVWLFWSAKNIKGYPESQSNPRLFLIDIRPAVCQTLSGSQKWPCSFHPVLCFSGMFRTATSSDFCHCATVEGVLALAGKNTGVKHLTFNCRYPFSWMLTQVFLKCAHTFTSLPTKSNALQKKEQHLN